MLKKRVLYCTKKAWMKFGVRCIVFPVFFLRPFPFQSLPLPSAHKQTQQKHRPSFFSVQTLKHTHIHTKSVDHFWGWNKENKEQNTVNTHSQKRTPSWLKTALRLFIAFKARLCCIYFFWATLFCCVQTFCFSFNPANSVCLVLFAGLFYQDEVFHHHNFGPSFFAWFLSWQMKYFPIFSWLVACDSLVS